MRIRTVFFLFCGILLFHPRANCQEAQQQCLLVAQLQEPSVLSSRKEITKLVDFARGNGTNIIFMQIYRANQAWFPSKLADPSPYNACFNNLSEDPINLLIRESHSKGIRVYAWLNMLSLSTNKNAFILKKYGTDSLTRNLNEKKVIDDYEIDNQYFLEPGDPRIREELILLVEEIMRAYPGLDGILFDYIRYPDSNPDYGYTKINIGRFKNATGLKNIDKESLVWKNWKREQVNELLTMLVKKVRAMRPEMQIGATGCVPYIRAYYEAYQDWPSWVNNGLVDFIMLMSYPDNSPEFGKDIREAEGKARDFKKIYVGVPAYKLVHNPVVFTQELRIVKASGAGGCVIFHYGSLLEESNLAGLLDVN